MRRTKNWKELGHDSLPVEFLKVPGIHDALVVIQTFHSILVRVVEWQEVPQEWKGATTQVLYKQADRFTRDHSGGNRLFHMPAKCSSITRQIASATAAELGDFCRRNEVVLL